MTSLELQLIKSHAQADYDILKSLDFPWRIADIVHQHHERLDGTGCPLGLKDGQILLGASILTDSVNGMASNLTQQVRNIADVTTAVAKGDLKRKLTVEAKGEIAELTDTLNNMTAALEQNKMEVLSAENGKAAIELLQKHADTNIVLMDIMMPQMDGYETMRQIRKMKKFESLPIIALTAKAMKGDREKCLAAGASDYVSKPVNVDQLLSLLRVWIYR